VSKFFYVTAPIYYVNDEPHMGHTYTTVLAEMLTRYHRLCGENTFMLTGGDEHGEKILEVAEQRGVPVAEIASQYAQLFQETWAELGIQIDGFVRTTAPEHERVVSDILQKVYDAGDIEFREYDGLYCVGCERFLTERDMEDGLCVDHERAPERRSESNYFFKMSEHFDWLRQYINDHPEFIQPDRYRNEVLSMLKDESGLGDLCISRPKSRLDWGIELPFDPDYVCYVWFDALISYISGIGYPDDPGFADFWAASHHLIAKDILKPHAVFWPCMLRSIGLEPARRLIVHGYWNVDDRKVSKSLGNMISPLIMRDRYGFDAFRYFLLRDMVFGLDSNFSEDVLVARINADLANNLGNLVSRALNMTTRFADGCVPEPGPVEEPELDVQRQAEAAASEVDRALRVVEPHRALEAIFSLVSATNRYLELREPWKAAKLPENAEQVRTTLYTCCEALRIAAVLLLPFLPERAPEILERLGLGDSLEEISLPDSAAWGGIPVGAATTRGDPLFPRIETNPGDA
jgi:methionyl-tRNA synthetase